MGRSDEFKASNPNPAKYFLEWRSNEKSFSFYNKETKLNVKVPLPFSFLVLKQLHTVRGWSDKDSCGIYSNEVAKISEEPLTVKSFKGGLLGSGLYSNIKHQIGAAGAEYNRSIYALSSRGELINIAFKASSVKSWGDFTKNMNDKLEHQWVIIKSASDEKKGAVNYSVPVFEFGDKVTAEISAIADAKYDELVAYLKGHKASQTAEEEKEIVEETVSRTSAVSMPPVSEPPIADFSEDESDDLPF